MASIFKQSYTVKTLGLVLVLMLMGCTDVDFLNTNQKEIEQEYQRIDYGDGIDQEEAGIIVDKYIIDYGWPWEMSGGRSHAIDRNGKWVFKYLTCVTGELVESSNGVLVDKKTGEISREFEKSKKKAR